MSSIEHFTFTRHRSGSPDLAFRPDGGAALSFVSMSDDTLSLANLRAGVLQCGDDVSVARGGSAVFRGQVRNRVWHGWRGTSVEESFSVTGPWSRMAVLPFTQIWMMMVERVVDGHIVATLEPVGSSRIVLNQGDGGAPLTVRQQVREILDAAAARGIIAAPADGDIAAIPEALTLPYDEARDLTCAQALARELRFLPALAVRFDYSVNPPALRIVSPAAENAGWLSGFALDESLLDVKDTQSGLPPLGCLLEITVTGTVEGAAYSFTSFQAAGVTSDPERTLRAVLPLSGSESSFDRRSLDLTTQAVPSDLNSAAFWRAWHADLKLLPAGSVVIKDASRTGSGLPRFVTTAGVGLGDLEEAGIAHFETERLLCTAVVTTSVYLGEGKTIDHIETADLSLEIIATDAETHLYRWTASGDMTSGETVPPGLADALLAAHQADGASAEVVFALKTGASLPLPGDTRNGLTAHTVTVDCRTLSGSCAFGPPASLGPVDLAGFLSGFRNIRRSSIHTGRATGEKPAKPDTDETIMLPSTSSGWVKRGDNKIEVAASDGSGGKVGLDPSTLTPDQTAQLHDLTFTTEEGVETTVKALLTEPVTIPPGGGDGMPDGTVDKVLLRWNSAEKLWKEIGPYEEIDVVLYTGDRKITGKLLFKATASDASYTSASKYKLLQVGSSNTLVLDYGRLADS